MPRGLEPSWRDWRRRRIREACGGDGTNASLTAFPWVGGRGSVCWRAAGAWRQLRFGDRVGQINGFWHFREVWGLSPKFNMKTINFTPALRHFQSLFINLVLRPDFFDLLQMVHTIYSFLVLFLSWLPELPPLS